jgi:hypothetical protein
MAILSYTISQKKKKLKKEFLSLQDFWSKRAKEKGILTEANRKRILKK